LIPRGFQVHAHPLKPGLKRGNGLLQSPPDPVAIVRVENARRAKIGEPIGNEGTTHLDELRCYLLQYLLPSVEESLKVPCHRFFELGQIMETVGKRLSRHLRLIIHESV